MHTCCARRRLKPTALHGPSAHPEQPQAAKPTFLGVGRSSRETGRGSDPPRVRSAGFTDIQMW